MARTHYVKSFRGQRKCQWTDPADTGWYAKKCGLSKNAAVHVNPSGQAYEGSHPFTQTPLRCEACGNDINIGDPYKWVAPRAYSGATGVKKTRHTSCPGWKQSELTSSQHLATIYGAQEAADDDIANLGTPGDDVESWKSSIDDIAGTFASNIREAEYSYQESAEAIEEGFGHETYVSQELAEKSEAIAGWADEVENWLADDYAGNLVEDLNPDDYEDDEEMLQDVTEQLDSWADEQIGNLTDLIAEQPF